MQLRPITYTTRPPPVDRSSVRRSPRPVPLLPLSPTTTITTTTPAVTTSTDCEATPSNPVPMFVWVEGPQLYTKSDFATFFGRLRRFIVANCVNIRPTTLIIRTPHPAYPPKLSEGVYWPPWNSPLFTELIAKLGKGQNIKILLYPYILDAYARSQWINFAKTANTRPVVSTGLSVYDGIFAFTNKWQQFVNSNNTVQIVGFILDIEEITTNTDPQYSVVLTPESFGPYRSAYPGVETAVTLGYDDKRKINYFDPFMDYLYLQVYDLYYPYAGSASSQDSLFEVYQNDPKGLLAVLLSKVLTSSVTDVYKGVENKIALMWSTQTLDNNDCLYLLNDGSCGVNREFNWAPAAFNNFVQLVKGVAGPLGQVTHGVYTFNFMRQDWLLKSDRIPPRP